MNQWNEMILCILVQIQGKKVISIVLGWVWSEMGVAI